MELYTIRARLTTGLLNKASRGELALKLPIGLTRDQLGIVYKDANLQVQNNVGLVFKTFLELKSSAKVLRFFNQKNLMIPRHDRFGDLVWKKPCVAAILSTLQNPAYTGAFVYGRTKSIRKSSSPVDSSQKQLPIEEWKIIVKNKYPAYIDWITFEKIQLMIKDNHAHYYGNKTKGVPRSGKALLHGIVYCGECSHKMYIQYKASSHYVCNILHQRYATPVCQYIPAEAIDNHVAEAFFQALLPIELDLYSQAISAKKETDNLISRANSQELERLSYQAALAQRQFNKVDPDNRLVACELERRWEEALRALKTAEEKIDAQQKQTNVVSFNLTAEIKEAFSAIGQKLPQIWDKEILSQQTKKALIRALIDKVIIHRTTRDKVETRIVWKGGLTTTALVPINVNSYTELSSFNEMQEIILHLAKENKSDVEIAQFLTEKGYSSAKKPYVLTHTVQTIGLKHKLFVKQTQSHPRTIAGFLTINQLAQALNFPRHWFYDHIYKGSIIISKDPSTSLFLFPDNPSTFESLQALKSGIVNNLNFL